MGKSILPLAGLVLLLFVAGTLIQVLLTGPNSQLRTLPQAGQQEVSAAELRAQPKVVSGSSVLSASTEPQPKDATTPTPLAGSTAVGKAAFDQFCAMCHPGGGKGAGPTLLGVSEEKLVQAVRKGQGAMPAFSGARLGDEQLLAIYAHIESLGGSPAATPTATRPPVPATPTAIPTPTPSPSPTVATPVSGGSPTPTLAPTPTTTAAPTPTTSPTPTATATPTPTPAAIAVDIARGQAEFNNQGCNACHPGGGKGLGPSIVGIAKEDFTKAVREGKGMMPAFGLDRLGSEALANMYGYLQGLRSASFRSGTKVAESAGR